MVIEMDKRNNKVVLSLGGNVGDVIHTFNESLQLLEKRIGQLRKRSSIYKTKAWGIEQQPNFLNQVVVFNTELSPNEVLKTCLNIELELGRVRKEKWHERVIDIDVLFYEDKTMESKDLVIPHPYIVDRNFILIPLSEIMPDFIHPTYEKSMLELKKECTDKLPVIKLIG